MPIRGRLKPCLVIHRVAEPPWCHFLLLRSCDLVFPLSAEEAAVEPTGGTVNRFTVFLVDVTR